MAGRERWEDGSGQRYLHVVSFVGVLGEVGADEGDVVEEAGGVAVDVVSVWRAEVVS